MKEKKQRKRKVLVCVNCHTKIKKGNDLFCSTTCMQYYFQK